MPQHLRDAADRRTRRPLNEPRTALADSSAAGAAISFASVAREANVSTDFLYRQPQLRQRIQQMRTTNGHQARRHRRRRQHAADAHPHPSAPSPHN